MSKSTLLHSDLSFEEAKSIILDYYNGDFNTSYKDFETAAKNDDMEQIIYNDINKPCGYSHGIFAYYIKKEQ